MKTSNRYYTAAQAKQVLGITHGMLYQYVRNGHLHSHVPPGKKQGLYAREEVDKLAADLHAFFVSREDNPPTKFLKISSRDEMREAMEISQAIFGGGLDVLDERMAILEKNPDSYYMLKAEDGMIVGYTSIMPLKPGSLEKVLSATLPVRVGIEDAALFKFGSHIDLYLTAMAVRPQLNGGTNAKRIYGARLISGLMEAIIDIGRRGIIIDNIAARSYTTDGIRLLRHAGFTEIQSKTSERRTFIIKVAESGVPYVVNYRNALEEALRRENS